MPWAEFLVLRVRPAVASPYIDCIEVACGHDPNGHRAIWTRQQLLSAVDAGRSVITAPPSTTDSFVLTRGAAISLVTVAGQRFLKSCPSTTPQDALDDLPAL